MLLWPLVLAQIIALDIILSGDNVLVVASQASFFPKNMRNVALVSGIALALLARILLVSFTGLLIHLKILSVIGGLLLFWVAYKMVKNSHGDENKKTIGDTTDIITAIIAIVIADLSMSLDNIVAIAGLSKGHPIAMVFGLTISVAIVGFGARLVSDILEKQHWLNWIGACLVVWVGLTMVV